MGAAQSPLLFCNKWPDQEVFLTEYRQTQSWALSHPYTYMYTLLLMHSSHNPAPSWTDTQTCPGYSHTASSLEISRHMQSYCPGRHMVGCPAIRTRRKIGAGGHLQSDAEKGKANRGGGGRLCKPGTEAQLRAMEWHAEGGSHQLAGADYMHLFQVLHSPTLCW